MTRLQPGQRYYATHMGHCNQDDYFRSCKYGENEICPALEGILPDPDREYVVKTLIHMAEQLEKLHPEYNNNIYRQAILLIDYHGHYHEY